MPVTLHAFQPLPNPQKALLALEEIELPYTIKTFNAVAAEIWTPEFLRLTTQAACQFWESLLTGSSKKTDGAERYFAKCSSGRAEPTDL